MNTNKIITINRTFGSGGHEIAEALAKHFHIPIYDRELLEMAQNDGELHQTLINGSDECLTYKIAEDLHSKGSHQPGYTSFVSDDKLFEFQSKTILTLAKNGGCVMVGRCADYVLRDFDNVLRIFIWAPDRICLRKIMHLYSLNPDEAKPLIRAKNNAKSKYYHHYTNNEWSDARNYDLCLNSNIGIDKCVEAILKFIENN